MKVFLRRCDDVITARVVEGWRREAGVAWLGWWHCTKHGRHADWGHVDAVKKAAGPKAIARLR